MIEFVCKHLAEMFSSPCNFSPVDEIMSVHGECSEVCGERSDAECWEAYFKLMKKMESEKQV